MIMRTRGRFMEFVFLPSKLCSIDHWHWSPCVLLWDLIWPGLRLVSARSPSLLTRWGPRGPAPAPPSDVWSPVSSQSGGRHRAGHTRLSVTTASSVPTISPGIRRPSDSSLEGLHSKQTNWGKFSHRKIVFLWRLSSQTIGWLFSFVRVEVMTVWRQVLFGPL